MDCANLGGLLAAGARIRASDCVPLQISRLLEERIAEAEGVKDVRHWLSLIGAVTGSVWIHSARRVHAAVFIWQPALSAHG